MAPSVDVFVQVRLSSRRLPGKALLPVGNRPCLGEVLHRLQHSRRVGRIIVCTTERPEDAALVEVAKQYGADAFQGSEHDCLERFVACADQYKSDIIVRICGDSPLVPIDVLDDLIGTLITDQMDYVHCRRLPVGAYIEAFTHATLERAWCAAIDRSISDDLTFFLNRGDVFRTAEHVPSATLQRGDLVLALNRPEDLNVLQSIFRGSAPEGNYLTLDEAIRFCDEHPDLAEMNQTYTPTATQCDTRLDLSRVPVRPAGLPWYRALGLFAQREGQ